MKRFWTSDEHYGGPNILIYANRPQLKSGDLVDGHWINHEIAKLRAEKMMTDFIRNHNQRVKKEDTVIGVGDSVSVGNEKGVPGLRIKAVDIFSQLNGIRINVSGNHDLNNSVKPACEYMSVNIGNYRAMVRHVPLRDESAYRQWFNLTDEQKACSGWTEKMNDAQREWEFMFAEFCRRSVDFVICGHVHQAWQTKKIAGLWHVNVGVDVHRYLPIDDQEILNIFDKAVT